jgi:hypothetical protein
MQSQSVSRPCTGCMYGEKFYTARGQKTVSDFFLIFIFNANWFSQKNIRYTNFSSYFKLLYLSSPIALCHPLRLQRSNFLDILGHYSKVPAVMVIMTHTSSSHRLSEALSYLHLFGHFGMQETQTSRLSCTTDDGYPVDLYSSEI